MILWGPFVKLIHYYIINYSQLIYRRDIYNICTNNPNGRQSYLRPLFWYGLVKNQILTILCKFRCVHVARASIRFFCQDYYSHALHCICTSEYQRYDRMTVYKLFYLHIKSFMKVTVILLDDQTLHHERLGCCHIWFNLRLVVWALIRQFTILGHVLGLIVLSNMFVQHGGIQSGKKCEP